MWGIHVAFSCQTMNCSVTFLLQSELSLGLDVLQGCSQVPGQTAGAIGRQQGALPGQNKCQTGACVEQKI